MKKVGAHLRALVYEYRMEPLSVLSPEDFKLYVGRIYRTQLGRVIFGDMVDCDLAMDWPEGTTGRNPEDYMFKLREAQSILVQVTQDYLQRHQRKRSVGGGPKNSEVTKFAAGDYVLLRYPNVPPNKLAGMYRGPMVITAIDRPDLVKVSDLITN